MSEQIRVVVAGIERSIDVGTTAADVFADEPEVIAAKVSGELADLVRPRTVPSTSMVPVTAAR